MMGEENLVELVSLTSAEEGQGGGTNPHNEYAVGNQKRFRRGANSLFSLYVSQLSFVPCLQTLIV
jgi:hypothetical protein